MAAVETVDGRGRRRRILVVGAVALAVVGSAAVAFALGGDDATKHRSVELAVATGGIQAIPGFPGRDSPASAILDGSLFVFGGSIPGSQQLRNDGVLVAPDFTSATLIPAAPFDPPLYSPSAVGVNGQIVVVGIACSVEDTRDTDSSEPLCVPGSNAAGVFDAGKHQWRDLKLPSALTTDKMAGGRALGATSDGRAVFVFFPYQHETFWSFDPLTDVWLQLDAPGVRIEDACLAGDTLVVLSASYRNHGVILEDDPARHLSAGGGSSGFIGDGSVLPTVASLDLAGTGTWAHSEPARDGVSTNGLEVACLNGAAAVVERSPTIVARVYSFTDRSWSQPPRPPARGYYPHQVWTGTELVLFATEADVGRPGLAYNPSTHTWRSVAGFPEMTRGALRAGSAVVGYSEPHGIKRANDIRTGGPQTATAGVFRYVPVS